MTYNRDMPKPDDVDIELGAIYRDSITKFEGVATSVTHFLYACARVCLQPTKLHEGKPVDAHYFDVHQVELIKRAEKGPAKPMPENAPTGGPGGTEAKQHKIPRR